MKNVPENELFSAYLDGELTAEEQAQVERLLAASPSARQLLDELRALSATLQAMPTYELEEDLTPRVLRAAERRMLGQKKAETEPPEEAAPPAGDLGPVPSPWKGIGRRLLAPRNLVWSAIAVAVAVMLMIFEPGHRRFAAPDREVARGRAERETRESTGGATIQALHDEANETPHEEAKEAAPGEVLAKRMPARPSSPAVAAEKPEAKSPPRAPVPGKSLAGKGVGAGPGYRYKAGESFRRGGKAGPSPEIAQGKLGGYSGRGAFPSAGAMPPGTGQTIQWGGEAYGRTAVSGFRHAQPWQPTEGTAVVFCGVSPQAARSRAFQERA
jgi:anti-sigma factor RsiW